MTEEIKPFSLFDRRSLFRLDSVIFLSAGAMTLYQPDPSSALVQPAPAGAARMLIDLNVLLGGTYVAVGAFLFLFATESVGPRARTLAARVRAITLLLFTAANVLQLRSGLWIRESILFYAVLFGAMAFAYIFVGFVRPEGMEASTDADP